MRHVLLLIFCLAGCWACTNHDLEHNLEQVDSWIQELVAEHHTLGICYGIQVGDSLVMMKSYGFTDHETNQPIEAGHGFRIASLTKSLTATAIMQLVESGKLSLEDPVTAFFPTFPKGDRVTIYHLLSHTSGIPNWWEGGLPSDAPENFPMCAQPHTYLAQMEKPYVFEPGAHYAYSNSGYILLGEIIEQVSQKPYIEYLKEYILTPAGMSHTDMEYSEDQAPNWIPGYAWNPELEQPFVEPQHFGNSMPYSAGGLRSTVPDLLNFLQALLAGKLVSHKTLKNMMDYSLLRNGSPVFTSPYSPDGSVNRFPPKTRNWGYGLGFEIAEKFGETVIAHGGDIAGFNAFFLYLPHNHIQLVILANTEGGIMSKLLDIEKSLIAIETEGKTGLQ